MVKGSANYTLVQVALNDIIMIFAFAPIVAFLLGVTKIIVPWNTLVLSVALYVLIPMTLGYFTRQKLSAKKLDDFLHHLKPYSVIGLLATVVLLFGFQANIFLEKPLILLLVAAPIIIQGFFIFTLTYFWAYKAKVTHNIAAPAALIGCSNFFELAVAVAISLFGLNSGAAFVTVVGVLVEVPAMLFFVSIANKTRLKFNK